jgi:hypothetical protein
MIEVEPAIVVQLFQRETKMRGTPNLPEPSAQESGAPFVSISDRSLERCIRARGRVKVRNADQASWVQARIL